MRGPILVTGGTGALGRVVVERLADLGHAARPMSRRPRPTEPPGVGADGSGWVTADLRSGAGLDAAVRDVDVIIHCANNTRATGEQGMAVTRNLVQAATRAGSPHLVYISIVGIDRVPFGYYRAKLADERLIESSGLPYTILRATQFHDLVRVVFAVSAKLPVMFVPGVRFQPVDVRDVAARLVELACAEPAGRALDIGGPEVCDVRDLARAYLRATGRRRLVTPVSLPGKVFRAVREGGNLTPEHADGTITFEEYLAGHPDAATVSYRGRR